MKQLLLSFQKRINFKVTQFVIRLVLFFCAVALNATNAAALDFHWETPPSFMLGSERLGNQALPALAEILTAFESGQIGSVAKIEAGIEPSMAGLTQLLQAIQDAQAQQQSIRIHLGDIKVNVNGNINGNENVKAAIVTTIITGRWEKRYLAIANRNMPPQTQVQTQPQSQPQPQTMPPPAQLTLHPLVPYLIKGEATFVFQCNKKQCKLSGMTGANLFASGL